MDISSTASGGKRTLLVAPNASAFWTVIPPSVTCAESCGAPLMLLFAFTPGVRLVKLDALRPPPALRGRLAYASGVTAVVEELSWVLRMGADPVTSTC